MSSVAQDDSRSASEALRRCLHIPVRKFALCCELTPRRYAAWERGDIDLTDAQLAKIRVAMLALAHQEKVNADKCLNFARRHQDKEVRAVGACGQA
jgi:hypothetical protein